ncbi:MAG TPA: AMP-binding protein [Marinobacterium sp.]|nr:AMP-binding protein [Marinobacterium sp.]
MAFANLAEFVSWLSERQGDARALVCAGRELSFRELDDSSRSIGLWLSRKLGLKPGARVLLRLPNDLHLPAILFGAIRAGLIPVLIPATAKAEEVERIIGETEAVATISLPQQSEHMEFLRRMEQPPLVIFVGQLEFGNAIERRLAHLIRPLRRSLVGLRTHWLSEALDYGRSSLHAWPRLEPSDVALIQYTSGTTAAPKGVEMTHDNLLSNMQQLAECMSRAGSSRQERMMISLPLYYSYPLMLMLTNWMRGGPVALVHNVRDTSLIAEQFDRFDPEVFVGINAVFLALCQDLLFPQLSFKSLQYTISGGANLNERVAERWSLITGTRIAQGYGLTEAAPVVTFDIYMRGRAARLGKALYQTQVRIVGEEGEELPPNTNGEIQVKGPQVMRGYLRQSERGLFPFTQDGWLRTGDIGRLSTDGELRLIERRHEVIRVPGFRVYPSELEAVISMHPSVLDCAVIGVPTSNGYHKIKLIVVTNDRRLTQRQMREYCRQRLTRYKVPELVEFRNALPHSASGRMLRQRLVKESMLDSQVGERQTLR